MWRRWVAFLSCTETGEVMALLRVALGASLLLSVGVVVAPGLADVVWIDRRDGGMFTLGGGTWLLRALGGPTPGALWILVAVTSLAALALIAGLGGRAPALVAGQAWLALSSLSPLTTGSDAILLSDALWLLFLARSTATWSLDCRLRTGRFTSDEAVPAWPRALFVFQLVILYFSTGIQKVSAYWTPVGGFSALYYILVPPTWARFDMTWLARVYPLTQLATATTWIFEWASPLLLVFLWLRRPPARPGRLRALARRFDPRVPFAIVGGLMHLVIAITMVIGPFSWVTLSLYVALLRPDEARRALARGHLFRRACS